MSGFRSWALSLVAAAALAGCSLAPRVAQTAYERDASMDTPSGPSEPPSGSAGKSATPAPPPPAAGHGGSGLSAADSCPGSLNDRLTIRSIDLNRDVRYKNAGFAGFPLDERVAFAAASDGSAYVAWTDDATGGARVTPLNAGFARRGQDIDVKSWDVGGLVARDDGFTLLTLRDDPGDQIVNRNGNYGRAVFLVRWSGTQEQFAVPLTGTRSITHKTDSAARDFAAGYVYGRLQWNGAKYGAYFTIFTAQGDPHGAMDTPADKLVYIDDAGGVLRGGWGFKCASSQGLRMWPEPDVYTPVCMASAMPAAGMNLVIEDQPSLLLAAEAGDHGWSGGQMGSIVKLPDQTYFIGWLSREVSTASAQKPLRRASDVAMLRLSSDRQVMGKKRWLLETPNYGETNLHFARYGESRLLMVWDRIDNLSCGDMVQMCFGRYAGTFARVIDADGNTLTPDTPISAVPNSYDDLVTMPNGDVVWAYVPDEARDYSSQLQVNGDGSVVAAPKRRISIARMRYCE